MEAENAYSLVFLVESEKSVVEFFRIVMLSIITCIDKESRNSKGARFTFTYYN